ncbi:EAL domain-containing protein [Haliea sp.]|uniref:sensor domain-containing phosphodiesterase n=1 Tax=Haliea sp. TaxID=1932666 RepID=UPI003526F301
MTPEAQEQRRLAALHRLGILDSAAERRFDRLVEIAGRFYKTPIALFSLLDENRQWFKARRGLEVTETPRCMAFCDHTVHQDGILLVEDASRDPRFCANPLVTGAPHIRFYAGVPVREPTGMKVGSLCIIDPQPRQIPLQELDVLRHLADILEDELERTSEEAQSRAAVPITRLNRAIHRAQNTFHAQAYQDAAFDLMLADLLELTGSERGFIGEVLLDRRNRRYLKIGATTETIRRAAGKDATDANGETLEEFDTLIALALASDDMVIRNGTDDTGSPDSPDGQATGVWPQLGIPIFSGSNRVGLVGLTAQRKAYTTEAAHHLDPLLQTVGQLIEHKRLYQEKLDHQRGLEQAANYDALTGLPNRRRLTELFDDELKQAELRNGTLSICFIDLDGFKEINDAHGHSVGDKVLSAVSSRLKNALREHDIVARLGGDEFVAIIRDVEENTVYERILGAIRQPIRLQNQVLTLGGSMGVTVYPQDKAAPDLLLRHADQAMYAAKDAGKNRYQMFDFETNQYRAERVKILENISLALQEGQLELYLQPKITLNARRVDGFEALIRWNHPDEGLLSPISFLPQLERTEYAATVGRFVIAEAVQKLQRWARAGLPYTLSINLSPTHFLGSTFVQDLRQALQDCDVELRSRLVIELLETTALDDAHKIIETLLECRELGVEVSLDDFGTGYSSLDHFRRLPAQEIKIDRSFVADMLDDPEDEMIVKSIIALSRNFNRRVIAEGIENRETQEKLIAMGCNLGQGFFYSRPLQEAHALAWAQQFHDSHPTPVHYQI